MVFWILINVVPYFMSSNYRGEIEELSHHTWYIILTVSGYFIIGGFIYFLYRSYNTISVTDSAKKLMENKLKESKNLIFISDCKKNLKDFYKKTRGI